MRTCDSPMIQHVQPFLLSRENLRLWEWNFGLVCELHAAVESMPVWSRWEGTRGWTYRYRIWELWVGQRMGWDRRRRGGLKSHRHDWWRADEVLTCAKAVKICSEFRFPKDVSPFCKQKRTQLITPHRRQSRTKTNWRWVSRRGRAEINKFIKLCIENVS